MCPLSCSVCGHGFAVAAGNTSATFSFYEFSVCRANADKPSRDYEVVVEFALIGYQHLKLMITLCAFLVASSLAKRDSLAEYCRKHKVKT